METTIMNKPFEDMTLEERIDHAQTQARHWRDIMRQLNRELIAITPQERAAIRLRVMESVEKATELGVAIADTA